MNKGVETLLFYLQESGYGMKFIGIDLAWTYKNETGLCVLDACGRVEYLDSKVYSNKEIVDLIKQHHTDSLTIAVDAPLIVPNEGGSRGAEGEMMRARINGHRISAFNSNRNYFTKVFGEIRGETLLHMIQSEIPNIQIGVDRVKSNIIETFPTGIVNGLFPEIAPIKYKIKPKIKFDETKSEMERLFTRFDRLEHEEKMISGLMLRINDEVTTKKGHKHLEDKVDAFLCAYGMYLIYEGFASEAMFGSVDKGFIVIPVIQNQQNRINNYKGS